MDLLILFIAGLLISFIASIPVGAVNMAVVTATLNNRRFTAYRIGLGAICVEAVYCAIPLFGVKALAKGTAFFDWMVIGSIPLLIILGIITIIRRKKGLRQTSQLKGEGHPLREILYGATLCLANPFILVFWTQIVFFLSAQGLLGETLGHELVFLGSVPIGTFLLYATFIGLAHKTKSVISLKAKVRANLIVGILFICLGVYLGISYYVGHKGQLKPGMSQNQAPPTESPRLLPTFLQP